MTGQDIAREIFAAWNGHNVEGSSVVTRREFDRSPRRRASPSRPRSGRLYSIAGGTSSTRASRGSTSPPARGRLNGSSLGSWCSAFPV
jgi:hypothetical protein